MTISAVSEIDYKPHLPPHNDFGIGIVGCGGIVKSAHLPAYNKHKLNVVGVYDPTPAATEGVRERFGVRHIFGSLDELLAHPEIRVVDNYSVHWLDITRCWMGDKPIHTVRARDYRLPSQPIDEGREPCNSARHNLFSLQMTLTACRSADADGQPMTCEEVG
ncbi:MAG: Gfo/Idh/MocA family oxidoreductase [Chloroflexi bacterium]|nr:Gfo/Idh/MocA family oxidoreductase [Chloroflexota bacterium]